MKSGTLLAQSVSQSVSQSVMPLVNMPPVIFRHTIGQAKCYRENGLVQVEYTGIITNAVMKALAPKVVAFCGTDVVLLRYDRATMCWPYQVSITEDVCVTGYGFWIVSPENRLASRAHCLRLLEFGIRRQVYLVDEILDAYHAARSRVLLAQYSPSEPCADDPEFHQAPYQTPIQA